MYGHLIVSAPRVPKGKGRKRGFMCEVIKIQTFPGILKIHLLEHLKILNMSKDYSNKDKKTLLTLSDFTGCKFLILSFLPCIHNNEGKYLPSLHCPRYLFVAPFHHSVNSLEGCFQGFLPSSQTIKLDQCDYHNSKDSTRLKAKQ